MTVELNPKEVNSNSNITKKDQDSSKLEFEAPRNEKLEKQLLEKINSLDVDSIFKSTQDKPKNHKPGKQVYGDWTQVYRDWNKIYHDWSQWSQYQN